MRFAPTSHPLPQWGRPSRRVAATPRHLLTLLSVAVLAAGCGRGGSDGQGRSGQSQVAAGAENTATPKAAPDVQPRYHEDGNNSISRVSTNATGQKGTYAQETIPPANSAGSADSPSDQALAQKVRVAISTGTTGTTGVYSEDLLVKIGVTAAAGVVTLTGEVGNRSTKEAFAERARAVGGVREVRNELRVVEGAPRPRPGAPTGRGQTDAVPQQDSVRPK